MAFTVIDTHVTAFTSIDMVFGDELLMLEGASLVTNGSSAILTTGNSSNITINGTVHAVDAGPNGTIGLGGSDNSLHVGRNGNISNSNYGAGAVAVSGTGARIVNEGSIMAPNAITVTDANFARIDNLGTIGSTDTGSNEAIILSGDVWNYHVINNVGLILGNIGGSIGTDVVRNSGTIVGDLTLGDGNDTFDGRGGTVQGVVSGGYGMDTYYVSDPSARLYEHEVGVTDKVFADTDWTLGDRFEDLELLGSQDYKGAGNELGNVINGNGGNNQLDGNAGADVIYGRGGDDYLRGNGQSDDLYGGDGDDVLRGGGGDDTLDGNAGADVLIGGLGADTLFGGGGEDTFVYKRASHSTNTDGDTIYFFAQGEDLIDLSGIRDDMVWRGSAGFTGTGATEVRLYEGVPGTRVKVDVNGDGLADMDILVQNVFSLTEDDFLL